MSRYEEIAHEFAAEGTEAAWAARDAILELVAEVERLRELVDKQREVEELMQEGARLRAQIIAEKDQTLIALRKTIDDMKQSKAMQAELIEKQSEIIKRLMGKGVLHA